MLGEVFILNKFSVYFYLNEHMQFYRANKMAAPIQSFLHVKLPITFLFSGRF